MAARRTGTRRRTRSPASRPAASSSAPRSRMRARRRLRPGAQEGQAARATSSRRRTTWSTARRPSRCTADAFAAGDRVLVVDDVLATGGTAAATVQLIRELRGRGRRSRRAAGAGLPVRARGARGGRRTRAAGAARRPARRLGLATDASEGGRAVTDAPTSSPVDLDEGQPGGSVTPDDRPTGAAAHRSAGAGPAGPARRPAAQQQPGARAAVPGRPADPPQGRPADARAGLRGGRDATTAARCARAATRSSPTRWP